MKRFFIFLIAPFFLFFSFSALLPEPVFNAVFENYNSSESNPFTHHSEIRNHIIQQAGNIHEFDDYQRAVLNQHRYMYVERGIDPTWADPRAYSVATRCTLINFLNGGMFSDQNKQPSELPHNFYDTFPGAVQRFFNCLVGTYTFDYREEFNKRINSSTSPSERCRLERAEMRRWAEYEHPHFRDFLTTLSVYDVYLLEIAAQLEHDAEFAERLAAVNHELPTHIKFEVKRIHEKKEWESRRQAEKQNEEKIRDTFNTQHNEVTHEILEYHVLAPFYKEHGIANSERFEQRKNAYDAAKDNPSYTTQWYIIDTEFQKHFDQLNLNSDVYKKCYGNQLQQVIHGECIELLQRTAALTETSELYRYRNPLAECIDSARAYNQTGSTYKAINIIDVCWTILDCGSAVIEGTVLGLKGAVVDLASHPIQTAACVVAGTYVFAYQLSKVAFDLLKIGTKAIFDPGNASKEWDDYIAPIKELFKTIQNNELKTRDIIKGTSQIAAHLIVQHKIFNALAILRNSAHKKFIEVTQKKQLLPSQKLIAVTPEGIVLQTPENSSHSTSSIKPQPSENISLTPITQKGDIIQRTPFKEKIVTPVEETRITPAVATNISWEEAVEISVKDLMIENNMNHVFRKSRHLLDPVIKKCGGEENLIRTILTIIKDKLPKDDVFDEISIFFEGNEFWVSGRVLNSVPRIGTFFIPDEKGRAHALAKRMAKEAAAARRQKAMGPRH